MGLRALPVTNDAWQSSDFQFLEICVAIQQCTDARGRSCDPPLANVSHFYGPIPE
jgi:hypothetical protein